MSQVGIIIHYGGELVNEEYIGGQRRLHLIQHCGSQYSSLTSYIHFLVGADLNSSSYVLSSVVIGPDGDKILMNLMNDLDLKYVVDNCEVPKVFVTVAPISLARPSVGRECVDDNLNENLNDGDFNVDDVEFVSDDDSLDDEDDELEDDVPSRVISRHIVPALPHSSVNDVVDDQNFVVHTSARRQWIIPGAVYQASLPIDSAVDLELYSRDGLCVGSTFMDKESMVTALGLYHLKNRVEYVVKRSSPSRFSATCKYPDDCNFLMRGSASGTVWRVFKWSAPHTCQMDFRHHGPRTLSSKVIGAFFAPRLMDNGAVLKPKEMAAQLRREFGFHVDYSVAYAGRNHAINLIYGDPDKSFQKIPSYLHMVQQCNKDSIIDLETDGDGVFRYCFLALGASIHGFLSSGRPVIVVDATHLKGKYKGVMFVAVTKDGNEQVFPLAVGLGDKENDMSWSWFFTRLKRAFGVPNDLLFVSDQHLSIKNAIEAVFPGVPHGLCTYHLQKNLARYGANIVAMFQRAAYSYKREQFDLHCGQLALVRDKGAYTKLMELQPSRWSRSYSTVRRYNFMTSNCAEVFNGRLRWGRRLPVCTLLEFVRTLIAHWFQERRSKALSRSHTLTEWAAFKLDIAVEEGRTMEVYPINEFKFTVSSSDRSYVVDLRARSCSCHQFDLDLIPCPHAAAAIFKSKQSCIPYVSSYYYTDTLREMYSLDVNPIPHQDEWDVPIDVSTRVVGTPNNPSQSGRPKTTRIPSAAESSSKSRVTFCSRCHQEGHYRSSCKEEIPIPIQSEEQEVSRQRRAKHCSICHKTGHTKRKCPSFDPSGS
ncbi:uncharacterized protein LOC130990604 [Salvia miltiorrhiza]|uniref:uncharacterized protein LOC130990604 n=1 Tax=Salvia miltiorrhiza TaxID=226208 RepID=UPI0025AC91F9|nr:uncharacterized protein LOC130990604 [Salvia miltiorrhiza]